MDNSTLWTAFAVDVTAVLVAITLLRLSGKARHSHPGAIYLAFHVIVVTWRLVRLLQGSLTIFDGFADSTLEPVSYDELLRATLCADAALITMTSIWAAMPGSATGRPTRLANQAQLRSAMISFIAAVSIITGTAVLLWSADIPFLPARGMFATGWDNSTWILTIQTWAGLGLLMLIYVYGFRLSLMVPMGVYLVIMGYQGFHRFRVVIPVLLLCHIYLDRHELRWPTWRVAGVLGVLGLAFIPMKSVSKVLVEGGTKQDMWYAAADSFTAEKEGSGETVILDECAAALTQLDRLSHRYYGSTYLAILTLPVPRKWWPEKPGLADYLYDLSTPGRPMGEAGMVTTYIGESYANFGYPGVVLLPAIFAYLTGRFYSAAYSRTRMSVVRFAYLMLACNLIQVYRDGFISIVTFTCVAMIPMVIAVCLHIAIPSGSASAPMLIRADA